MKKVAFFALIAGAVAFTACGGNKKQEDSHEGHDHSHHGHDHSHDHKSDSVVVDSLSVDSLKVDSTKVDTTKVAQ
jgi:ABC-type Zn2+ transport system substrate-binding protein/surface adhesin